MYMYFVGNKDTKKKQKTLALIIMHIYTCTTRSQTTDVLTSIRVNLEEYSREKS